MEMIKEEPAIEGREKVEEEVISHEEEDGETRCVCGEIDPPDDSGLYIQCEQCSVWQHGSCVGIADGEDSHVEKYWCEQCKPELHHLYTVDSTGATRSMYRPVAEKRRVSRRSNRHTGSEQIITSSEKKVEEEPMSPTASSSSSRSRGSRAIKESPLDDSSIGQNLEPEAVEVHHGVAEPTADISDGAHNEEEDKKLQDRKRATFSAREEKQYQWMLEKAIKESRRTSHQEDDADNSRELDNHEEDAEASVNSGSKPTPAADEENETPAFSKETVRNDSDGTGRSNISSIAINNHRGVSTGTGAAAPSPLPEKQTPLSVSRSSNSTSEDDSKKRQPSRRSQRASKASKRINKNSHEATSNNKGRSGNSNGREIGINKPMKPRIPPQRTSLNEMRRRVSAILEFISRTQWELSESHSSRNELVRFVENQQFIDQVDSIFEKYDQSFKLMDDLTRSLLLWEKRYSNSSSIQE